MGNSPAIIHLLFKLLMFLCCIFARCSVTYMTSISMGYWETGWCYPCPTLHRGHRLLWRCGLSPASSLALLQTCGLETCILFQTMSKMKNADNYWFILIHWVAL